MFFIFFCPKMFFIFFFGSNMLSIFFFVQKCIIIATTVLKIILKFVKYLVRFQKSFKMQMCLYSIHGCTWFENPGSMRFLPKLWREGMWEL
jgi:hypothetical protein